MVSPAHGQVFSRAPRSGKTCPSPGEAVASIGRALPVIILKTVAACLTSLFKPWRYSPHGLRSHRLRAAPAAPSRAVGARFRCGLAARADCSGRRSSSSPARRRATAALASGRLILRQIYLATAPLLTWFVMLSALVSLVLIRIVVATSVSYGLSQYALEVLVRTLVLELIPLYAALFVAVRFSMPGAQHPARAPRPAAGARALAVTSSNCCRPSCCRGRWPGPSRCCCWRR
jgi:hypothetical protein